MRKIEREMIKAIDNFKYYRKDNTEVKIMEEDKVQKLWIYLHGHQISNIYKYSSSKGVLVVRDAKYQTKTTKSRLNCILSHYNLPSIYSKKFQWYLGDEEWNGSKTFEIN